MRKFKFLLPLIPVFVVGVCLLFDKDRKGSGAKSISLDSLPAEALEIRNRAEERLLESRSGSMYYLPKVKEAEEMFIKVLTFEEDSDTYANLGIIYGIYGDFERSEEYFNKALGLNPNSTFALNNLAKAYYDQGKFKLARDLWQKSLEVDDNQLFIINQISKLGI